MLRKSTPFRLVLMSILKYLLQFLRIMVCRLGITQSMRITNSMQMLYLSQHFSRVVDLGLLCTQFEFSNRLLSE